MNERMDDRRQAGQECVSERENEEDSRSVRFLSQRNEQNEETAYRWHQSVYYTQLQV